MNIYDYQDELAPSPKVRISPVSRFSGIKPATFESTMQGKLYNLHSKQVRESSILLTCRAPGLWQGSGSLRGANGIINALCNFYKGLFQFICWQDTLWHTMSDTARFSHVSSLRRPTYPTTYVAMKMPPFFLFFAEYA